MNKVLVIDDDKELCALMKKCVEQENLTAVVAGGGIEGLHILEEIKDTCSLIILDIMMPDLDGFQVLKQIRQTSNVPVLMLTAKSDEEDKVCGLRMGADDYLTKPFSVEELLARLRVTQRRLILMQSGNHLQAMFVNGHLRIDYASGCAYLGEEEMHLTPIEYRLLCLLAQNIGKVLTHKFITQSVWGNSWGNEVGSLRVYMATLRKKLEKSAGSPQYIQTHVGIGYRMLKIDNPLKD